MKKVPCWVFGYGSIIWHTDFSFLAAKKAYIQGWERKFWQGSHDHRGTVHSPGRVVTLIANAEATCTGRAYLIEPEILEHLDYREKNGYKRHNIEIAFAQGDTTEGIVYIAPKENPAFLGPASVTDIAQQIFESHGPSGSNTEYFLKLAGSLRDLGCIDRHICEIETVLRQILARN